MLETTANKLKRLRKEKGMPLNALAKAAGTSGSYLCKIENPGKKPINISASLGLRLAKALDVSLDYLVGETELPEMHDMKLITLLREYQVMDDENRRRIAAIAKILNR